MKLVAAFIRSATWWLVPLALLVAIVAYETGFGQSLRKTPPAPTPLEPKPVVTALLPEYAIAGGLEARRETIDRTLFTPTRRPAPPLVAQEARAKMQRGQFALTGTLIADGKHTAFLREVNGGRPRKVSQGDTVNGLLVAEVKPDRVKLSMGDEVEELVLRVSPNPRPTPAGAPGMPIPAVPVQPQPMPSAVAPPGVVPNADVAQTLAERRRAARAAQAAAAAATPQVAQPGAATGSNGAVPAAQSVAAPPVRTEAPGTPTWNDVYKRYQYRTQ